MKNLIAAFFIKGLIMQFFGDIQERMSRHNGESGTLG